MFDVLVIGGGPGGYAAAIRASQLGGQVALVESAELGGTCVNRGCIPSKVWLHAGKILQLIKAGEEFGIKAVIEQVDHAAILDRRNGTPAEIRLGMESLLKNNKVEVIKGRAVLKGPHEVDVDGTNLEGKKIILATGSCLEQPNIPGLKEAALTTDQVLEMTEIPASVLMCVSGGPIEVEMANLLTMFGSKVVLVSESRSILPREDGDTNQRLSQSLREQGVEILPRFTLQEVKKSGKKFACLIAGPKERTIKVEKVLVGSRRPNTSDLGLENVGVRLNEDGGIWINEHLETSVKGIYAIGDATGGWMLSHVSSGQAVMASENAMGKRKKFPFHLISRALWTIPEVGAVGLTEDEADKQGYDVEVGDFPYSINGLAMARGETTGAVKVVSDARYGEILGVHIVGGNATELVGEAVLAMQLEATVNELAQSIRIHPTFSEAVVDAAREAKNWALYLPKR